MREPLEFSLERICIFEHFNEFVIFMQFLHNIEAPNKIAVDIELGEGGPIRILLNSLPHIFVVQYVEMTEIDG